MSTRPIASMWIAMASGCLLLSGLLSVIITSAKATGLKELITNLDAIRWCLVIHVNLSSLVWFTALPVGLIHMTQPQQSANLREKCGFFISALGLILMLSVPPQPDLQVVLANYIPILAHPRYYAALILYACGVLISMATPQPLYVAPDNDLQRKGLSEIGFGLSIGALFFLLALGTTAFAYRELKDSALLATPTFFEMGMWGGGHLLQHASAVFMLCCWVVLMTAEKNKLLFKRSELFPLFAWISLPVFIAPLLVKFSVMSGEYRVGFTLLMQLGIAPPVLVFIVWMFRRLGKISLNLHSYKFVAVVFSSLLIIIGFLFGAFINGPDMRVPGHYHASIGAVSLTMMATAFYLLERNGLGARWMLRSAWTYGIGQSLFASGMFIAGTYGMSRKTYGSEHHFGHWGQSLGFYIMAGGGLVALMGGVFFALAIFPHLTPKKVTA